MPHIKLPEGSPGIRGPMAFSPATTKSLCELAEVLLHAPNTLSAREREIIAIYVSSLRMIVYYCQTSHGAIAAHHAFLSQ